MSLLLLDTSVWIEYLRDTGSPACVEVDRMLSTDLASIRTSPPIVMELLAGARSDPALTALERLTTGLPSLDLAPSVDWHHAAAAYRAVRSSGSTVRGLIDCLIAVVAQRHDAALIHRDKDLAAVCAVLGVREVDLR